ncbi:MAG TPA: GTPase ObgE [Candidatus Limnocylindria bacterium]|nr:GTPase ObgE [Candidatus Limnocylindria bacterium]
MFLDRVRLRVRGGDGGRGVISFRREAHVPRGGPDGGDGGHGGDVVLRVDASVSTLSEFRFVRALEGQPGSPGAGKDRSGKAGADAVARVPPGTLVTDRATGEAVADLVTPGDEIVVARGGRGGKGNARFVTSVRRVPRIAEDGGKGEERELELELKLIADVGLAGLPNAGKSSLLAALTRARPKIADYPFTTLSPNLGVARLEDRELVVADIPGLIEGAHAGAGLGEEFLRHIERTRLLVHVVDASRDDPLADMRVVEREIEAYGRGLAERPRVVALNKMDLPEARDRRAALVAALGDVPAFALSAATGEGVDDLKKELFVRVGPAAPAPPVSRTRERRIAFARTGRAWSVEKEGEAFRLRGDRFERLASGLDWGSADASAYFHRLLARSGVERELRSRGIKEGDTVRIGDVELEWTDLPGG